MHPDATDRLTNLESLRTVLDADVFAGARSLLGCHLVRGELRARIVEVEAYGGDNDLGSHAHRGPTPRNLSMFGAPGRAYVYFTYGMHWMLNVVAKPDGHGAAVLIRAAQPITGIATMRERRPKAKNDADLLSGPAKIAAAFGVTIAENGCDLLDPESPLRIELGEPVTRLLVGPRVGMAVGKGDTLPWRFVDTDALKWVSRPHATLVPLGTVN